MLNLMHLITNAMNNSELMRNPMASNTMELYKKGDSKGLQQLAENICREKGTTPQEVYNKFLSRR